MKIENGNKTDLLDSLVKTAQVKPQKQHVVDTNKEKNTHAFDKVELSAGKQEIDRLKASAKAQPAVRQERVELLREAIEEHIEEQYTGRVALMSTAAVIEITKREGTVLKEFLTALRAERDAIISFSLEGIIEGNNRKEEILKKLEYLKAEKEKLLQDAVEREAAASDKTINSLNAEMVKLMKEIKGALDKNMKLLSFSIDHVRSSIENIVGSISTISYGKKSEKLSSVLLSKVV